MDVALDQPVLVLNRLWQAVNVIGARRAFALLARGHAHVVHHHDDDFRMFSMMDWIDFSASNPPVEAVETVHTPTRTIRLPRVILLTFFDKLPCKELKLTRGNVFDRDKNTCQYCSRVLPREQLKNGGVRGLIVVETLRGRLPKQAKIGIVDKRDLRNFDLIPRAELNPAVADRFDEWFLNNSWKVKPTSASSKASDFGFSEREVFYPLAKAKKLAEEARKGDPDWTYKVTPPEGNQRGLAKVVVFDEDGEEIGSL
jgi:hypothetical protein